MVRRTISVKFYARKGRATAAGLAPVCMRVYLGDQKFETNTKIYVKPEEWKHEKVKGTNEEAKRVNKCIEGFKMKAFDLQRELMNEGKDVTLANIKAKWFGISLEHPRMLMEIFTQHNRQMKELVNKEFSPLTYERYETSFRHTKSFLRWKLTYDDIDIKQLNYEFIADYEFWLKTERRCDHNTTVKYLSNFKKIVRIAIKNGWLARDPFVGFNMIKREVDRPFLVEDELNRIVNKVFSVSRMSQVRDTFAFCCYTGLAYADVKKLRRGEITIGIDGQKWISIARQKTETRARIPLLPPALEILERYSEDPQCLNNGRLLPVLSNQKMNGYLKEIADACEINKKMTCHTARHTFATTVTLTNGVPIETVGKMLGHRNLKTTQHYAKILDKKISEDMNLLRVKIASKDNTGTNPQSVPFDRQQSD